MCVSCMFHVDWELGRKKFKVGIFLSKNMLGSGYRKQKTFLGLIHRFSGFSLRSISDTLENNLELKHDFINIMKRNCSLFCE